MRTRYIIIGVALGGVLSCHDSVGLDQRGGGIALDVQPSYQSGPPIEAGRILVRGPTNRTIDTAPGQQVTIDKLAPGEYTVALEGLVDGEVAAFGERTGVQVVAGQTARPTVSFASFVPPIQPVPPPQEGLTFTVTFGSVPGAVSYEVEASTSETFTAGLVTKTVQAPATSAEVTVPDYGTWFVRVRARNSYQRMSVPSEPQAVSIVEALADLVITTELTLSPNVVEAGSKVTLSSWTLQNQGTAMTNGIANGFYLSSDAIITPDDLHLDGNGNSPLGPGKTADWGGPSLIIPAETAPGNYYVGIFVDVADDTPEQDETNNYRSAPLTITAPIVGSWSSTGDPLAPRRDHSAVLLSTGKVLIIGGTADGAELYDPATGRFTATSTPPVAHRQGATAIALANGKVLIVGGLDAPRSATLYDPVSGAFVESKGTLNADRQYHTATLLADGRVLLAGGQNRVFGGPLSHASAEVYDPATDEFTPTDDLNQDRSGHAAVLLADGQVLLMGGTRSTEPGKGVMLASAELYDPVAGVFVLASPLKEARTAPEIVTLRDGRILVVGGVQRASTEVYDPVTRQFTMSGSMSTVRNASSATLLADGRVLVAGGNVGGSTTLGTAEVYYPSTGQFTAAASMITPRQGHSATLLPGGRVLVAAGYDPAASAIVRAELFSIP